MTEKTPTIKASIDDISAGAVITISVPCKVRVTRIEPVDGSMHRGNNEVSWEMVEPIRKTGVNYLGSKVQLSVWD